MLLIVAQTPIDVRLFFAYHCLMPDEPQRQKNALLIAASLIAAVRCAREEEIKPNPRVIRKVDDSVRLAKMVLKRIEREEMSTPESGIGRSNPKP